MALRKVGKGKKTILSSALQAPYEQIQENAGSPFEVPVTVLDSYHSVSTALKVACSTAGTAITMANSSAYKNEHNTNKNQD